MFIHGVFTETWIYTKTLNLNRHPRFTAIPEFCKKTRSLQGNQSLPGNPEFSLTLFQVLLFVKVWPWLLPCRFHKPRFVSACIPSSVCLTRKLGSSHQTPSLVIRFDMKVFSAITVLYKLPVDQAPGFDEASVWGSRLSRRPWNSRKFIFKSQSTYTGSGSAEKRFANIRSLADF